jgi:hypothetical protein
MLKQIFYLVISLLFCSAVFADTKNDSIPNSEQKSVKVESYAPTVGLGVGMLKFYGDVRNSNRGNPFISNVGYDLHVYQQLNSFLTAKFYVLFGTLSADEKSLDRNLNFNSKITAGGFELMYNFDHILPKDRDISPYLSLGIESVEFNSKTDLYDKDGNNYNYWSDGTIRDISETGENSSNATIIQRDYVNETDLRELNYDGFGKYSERTFAIPLGIGVNMHLTDNIDFSVGSSYHFTFSDLIDNINDNSSGERLGNQRDNGYNDNFLLTSFSLSYNFQKQNQDQIYDFSDLADFDGDGEDEDGDGVSDFKDKCPWTPEGVEVDKDGCPLDLDNDLVPNYRDDELETVDGADVTPLGVEMTDDMIFEAYQRYMDSTGMFAETETKFIAAQRLKKKKYKVQIGEFIGAIDAELVDKFLSVPDVEIKTFGDTLTIIAVGDYNSLPDAIKRKMQLTAEGFDAAIVVEEEKDGTFTSVGDKANNMSVDYYPSADMNSQGLSFRVQLGAFSNRLPKTYLNNVGGGIMEIKADDGLWKYLHQKSSKTIQEAAELKITLAVDYGIEDAFIVAYKDGRRIPLSEAGVVSSSVENIQPKKSVRTNKSAVKFKVQIGSYKNQLPTDVLTLFMKMKKVQQEELTGGLVRYTAGGEFSSYQDAQAFKEQVIESGIGGAFVIAFYEEELIPIAEAKEILED